MRLIILTLIASTILWACNGTNADDAEDKDTTAQNDDENNDGNDSSDDDDDQGSDSNDGDDLVSYDGLQLDDIVLPDGFKIDVFGRVNNARSLALSPDGVLYVGNRSGDKVYALVDNNGDMKADEKYVLAEDLRMPNGVAFKDGDLYVAEVSKLWKFENIENDLGNPPAPELIYDDYPSDGHHGWKYIAFGPDGKLYVPVGAPCNICESKDERYAAITRMDPDGTNREVYASGVRNTVGFTWHPETEDLWFTDNGRDNIGGDNQSITDNSPPCELNVAAEKGNHYGYPYCHGDDISDPEFGHKRECDEFKDPAQNLGPHTAPLGVKFYTGDNFPPSYTNKILIAEHGSWNRSTKIGYRVTMVEEQNGVGQSYETFASGWLNDATQQVWGRPVDLVIAKDGSMLLSDDLTGTVYRIWYEG